MSAVTNINGREVAIPDEELEMNLLEWLREVRDLTGTKNGCGIGVCGACTVLIDGRAVRTCRQKVAAIAGKSVVTIEGVSPPEGPLHPLQQAFIDYGAIQCGFCTPGMVMAGLALLARTPHPARPEIRKALATNLCRCTGYQQIVDAIEAAARGRG